MSPRRLLLRRADRRRLDVLAARDDPALLARWRLSTVIGALPIRPRSGHPPGCALQQHGLWLRPRQSRQGHRPARPGADLYGPEGELREISKASLDFIVPATTFPGRSGRSCRGSRFCSASRLRAIRRSEEIDDRPATSGASGAQADPGQSEGSGGIAATRAPPGALRGRIARRWRPGRRRGSPKTSRGPAPPSAPPASARGIARACRRSRSAATGGRTAQLRRPARRRRRRGGSNGGGAARRPRRAVRWARRAPRSPCRM